MTGEMTSVVRYLLGHHMFVLTGLGNSICIRIEVEVWEKENGGRLSKYSSRLL